MSDIELYVERAQSGECAVHIPEVIGCSFRVLSEREILEKSFREYKKFEDWYIKNGFSFYSFGSAPQFLIKEIVDGYPIWVSGNPAALFSIDLVSPTDERVENTFYVIDGAIKDIKSLIAQIAYGFIINKNKDRRSIVDTLFHMSDVIWWYCSRIEENLAEPAESCPREPIGRMEYLSKQAREFLLSVPLSERDKIVVPLRYAGSDPSEKWTMGKVLRRQSEHILEHRFVLLK